MLTDAELLKSFAEDRSEPAFNELVVRHMGLVYSAALRETQGNSGLAEEISQAVFTELAQNAARLRRHPALAGWLYTSVRWMTANARRADQRRQRREQEVYAMNELCSSDSPEVTWRQVAPLLDDAMHEMNEKDRAAVVLRFFEDRTHKDVGLALGLSENAARLRVDRALEKLRNLLLKRGVTSSVSGLVAAMAVGVTAAPPPGLAATVASAAFAATAAAAASSSTFGLLGIMSMTKLQAGVAGVLILSAITLPIWQESRIKRLQSQNTELHARTSELAELRQRVEQLAQVEADRAELERLRHAHSQLVGEVAKLRGNAGLVRRMTQEAAELRAALERQSTNAAGEHTPKFLATIMDGAKGLETQEVRNRIARLREVLNLSAEQSGMIQEILAEQAELRRQGAKKLMLGELTAEDRAEIAGKISPASVDEKIKAILTPEQQAAYGEYQRSEFEAQARFSANRDVIQLERRLGLTDEQQDRAFLALYNVAMEKPLEANKGDVATTPEHTLSKAAAIAQEAERERSALERRSAALEGILNPTQLESYRATESNRISVMLDMFRAVKTGANPN